MLLALVVQVSPGASFVANRPIELLAPVNQILGSGGQFLSCPRKVLSLLLRVLFGPDGAILDGIKARPSVLQTSSRSNVRVDLVDRAVVSRINLVLGCNDLLASALRAPSRPPISLIFVMVDELEKSLALFDYLAVAKMGVYINMDCDGRSPASISRRHRYHHPLHCPETGHRHAWRTRRSLPELRSVGPLVRSRT